MSNRAWWIAGVLLLALLVLFGTYWYEDEVKGFPPPSQQAAIANAQLVGTWQSTSDPNFTREFRGDGHVIDRYQGNTSASMEGAAVAFDPSKDTVPGLPADSIAGTSVLKIEWRDGTITYTSVKEVSDSSLTLLDLSGRGAITTFTKAR